MARRRGLTADEKALWSRIAATAVPMHPSKAPEPTPLPKPSLPVTPEPARLAPLPDFRIGAKPLKGVATRIDLSPHPGRALHPRLQHDGSE